MICNQYQQDANIDAIMRREVLQTKVKELEALVELGRRQCSWVSVAHEVLASRLVRSLRGKAGSESRAGKFKTL
jgi:hypothetical protein